MSDTLESTARVLLRRMTRSFSPWRVQALLDADKMAMQTLVTAGLVEVDRGAYRPTPAGRAALVA